MILKTCIPEEVKYSEQQVGQSPGRLENHIGPDYSMRSSYSVALFNFIYLTPLFTKCK